MAEDTEVPCAVCRQSAIMKDSPDERDVARMFCPRCGPFSASGSAYATLTHMPMTPRQRANASGWLREHPRIELSTLDIKPLESLRSPRS